MGLHERHLTRLKVLLAWVSCLAPVAVDVDGSVSSKPRPPSIKAVAGNSIGTTGEQLLPVRCNLHDYR